MTNNPSEQYGRTCGFDTHAGPCILESGHPIGYGLFGQNGHTSSLGDMTVLTSWIEAANRAKRNIEATEVPDGSIRTADLINVTNAHSDRNNWCESVIGLLNDIGLHVTDGKSYDRSEHAWVGPRVERTQRTPQYVTKDAVGRALTKARKTADVDEFTDIATELKDRWGIEPEPEYNDTYVVTFKFTADDLRRDDYQWDNEYELKESIEDYVRDNNNDYELVTVPDPNRSESAPQEPQVPCTCRAFTEGGGHSHGCHYSAGNPAVAQK